MSVRNIELLFKHCIPSLARPNKDPALLEVVHGNTLQVLGPASNIEDEVLPHFIESWAKIHRLSTREPILAFVAAIQFFDDYKPKTLPVDSLPSPEHLLAFILHVQNQSGKSKVTEQLDFLLDYTDGDMVLSANIAMLACRIMARNSDTHAYPEINVSYDDMKKWAEKVVPFEVYGEESKVDSAGDLYYFWTYIYLTFALHQPKNLVAHMLNSVVEHGTKIMRFVKGFFAKQQTVSPHAEASMIGRQVARAMLKFIS